jgi:guanine deaminase
MSTDTKWLLRAIELATRNAATDGGPFGAVVVAGGLLVGEGTNRVTASLDPTAHGEIVAMRAACQNLQSFSLAGATVYTSCEPCPMCLAAMLWARVDRVVYAADQYVAAAAGFDDAAFHKLLPDSGADWPLMLEHLALPEATAPFEAWLANADHIAY